MKTSLLSIPKIIITTFAGLSVASLLASQPSVANTEQPFSSLETDRDSNSLFSNGSDFNIFDLMHRAQFGTINWDSRQQNQQINDAAAAFRAKQKKLLQNQPQNTNLQNLNGDNAAPLITLPANK
ncbi:MAG: hypothetical protein F6K62_05615 [Sphaerospermopsis sp. SIO1G2]|nr:hypothetical protein [Sphaerospermopsis sp. SIO1G1]NET70474.1 hypothetical protein [Sphaerospermopsis sp. SIO1G2]